MSAKKAIFANAILVFRNQVHLKERNYPCHLCGNCFARKDTLTRYVTYARGILRLHHPQLLDCALSLSRILNSDIAPPLTDTLKMAVRNAQK